MRLEEEREKLMKQIQRNIAELSILNDGIRNPLSIIEATLEVNPERPHEEIHRQIDRIDAMITQLDKRWAESEKIFSYLNKHYGIHY
jgi:chromosome segregation ATPase